MKKLISIICSILGLTSCGNSQQQDLEKGKLVEIEANRKTINALKNAGNNFEIERDVFHWIYFKSKSDQHNYFKEVQSKNFKLVLSNKIDGEFPYQLELVRKDKVTESEVNEYVLYLWRTALKYNGDYDGWETSVEK
ncbi:ribonuclease E inhibitor RraB [Flavobacterium amniphilum]|uniref:ribonuclease E inhibitor RraB n=1 Tax=Flavobacterium amniphilum TaxID=1834035 RepID=UPI00202A616C|nr:ribonuclease E inhibitor RraB [Flavobacterium amniphilum]MCL9806787.1 ribonuclease E inhibitor RraB [Flavobacterium amniphilum]